MARKVDSITARAPEDRTLRVRSILREWLSLRTYQGAASPLWPNTIATLPPRPAKVTTSTADLERKAPAEAKAAPTKTRSTAKGAATKSTGSKSKSRAAAATSKAKKRAGKKKS